MSKDDRVSEKISAFIVCFNEEEVIGRCLESIKGVVDEIIVIHDGPCTDRTLEISKRFTNNVFETKTNRGIGESHYITALKKTSYNWVLRIDADEYLSVELKDSIRSLITNSNIAAFNFVWPIWNGNKYITSHWPYKIFLFQKDKIGIINLFHHPIVVRGESRKVPLLMHHQPKYNNYTSESFARKIRKWCKLQAKDYLKPLDEIEVYNVDLESVQRERQTKTIFYNFPVICFIVSFSTVALEILKNPLLAFQNGFWLTALLAGKYSFFVSKEYINLKKNLN